jgi:hypothetical protein
MRRIMGTAKGFASFGGIFVLFECMVEHVRAKDDGINSFLAGMATSMLLGANGNFSNNFSDEEKIIVLFWFRRRHDVFRILQSI